jgi:hypothetical protein
MIEANNKMFVITFGLFMLIVVCGFLATMFFSSESDLANIQFKSAKVKLQLFKDDTENSYYYNVVRGDYLQIP